MRDGSSAAVQRYHEQGVSQELRDSSAKASSSSNGSNGASSDSEARRPLTSRQPKPDQPSDAEEDAGGGPMGWLKKRFPFNR
jgi:hypothetical protein